MKFKKIITLFFVGALLTGCADDDLSSESIFDTASPARNEFDQWLKTNFTDQYNIDFIYRYNDKETDNTYNVIPADIDKSKALAVMVKDIWLDAYAEAVSKDFIKKYSPRVYQLIGSAEFRTNGEIVLGTAEGGLKITLFRVNAIDLDNLYINQDIPFRDHYEMPLDMNYWFFHTMHHEFCHILTQLKNYPTDFQEVSAGKYHTGDWINVDDADAPLEGFVTGYASSEYNEDFAEIYATYITSSDKSWQERLDAGKVLLSEDFAVDADGNYIYKKDADGNLIPKLDKDGNPVYVRDENGDIVYEKDEDGNFIIATDEEGNPIVMRDADGKPVKKLDDFGNPVYDVDFETGQVYYVYEYEKVPMIEYERESEKTYDTSGSDAIEQKLEIIKTYFKENWDIDLEKLREIVLKRSQKVTNGIDIVNYKIKD